MRRQLDCLALATILSITGCGSSGGEVGPDQLILPDNWTKLDAPVSSTMQLAWSPIGDVIAYAYPSGLWTVTIDGTTKHQLTAGDVASPSWSPDGTKLAFVRIFKAYTISLSTLTVNEVTAASEKSPSAVAWSPDGSKLLFGSSTALWYMSASGSGPVTELQNLSDLPGNIQNFMWADNSSILVVINVFVTGGVGYECRLYRVSLFGGAPTQVFDVVHQIILEPVSVSGDLSYLGLDDNDTYEVYSWHGSGTQPQKYTDITSLNSGRADRVLLRALAWSPDKSTFAVANIGAESGLYLIR